MAKRDRQQIKAEMTELYAGAEGVISQVVAEDRRRAGRGTKTANYDNMTSNNVIKQSDNMTGNNVINRAAKQSPMNARRGKQTLAAEGTAATSAATNAPESLAARIQQAAEMAASPTITVTLRLPLELNHWLDSYVHGAWPERIRKQELVTEALRLLIARRGAPGEAILATDFLPEEKITA